MNRFILLGGDNAVNSLSPLIHNEFHKQYNLSCNYEIHTLKDDIDLHAYIKTLLQNDENIKGFNITTPFKSCFNDITNTINIKNNKLEYYNTDGIGFINDLKNKSVILKNKTILIIGYGSVAKILLKELLHENVANVICIKRDTTPIIYDKFSIVDYNNSLLNQVFDLVINTTPLSHENRLPILNDNWFNKNTICYDVVYLKHKSTTIFNDYCLELGCDNVYDGLGMLVEQAAESFKIWYNYQYKLDTIKVLNSIRNQY